MSVVVPVGGIDPEVFWRAGALPLAVVLDLALGDVPGRTAAVRWVGRLIAGAEGRIGRLVSRLGGGRGGDWFGGVLTTSLVTGTAAGLAWLAADLADAAGGPVSLAVRTLLIASGLSIRATGDALLQAIEAPDPGTAARWLGSATGQPIGRPLRTSEVGEVAIESTGDLISGSIVAPLVWLAIGGPAAFWGFTALRLLGQAMAGRAQPENGQIRVPRLAADWAERPGSILGAGLVAVVAPAVGLRPRAALRAAWRGRGRRLDAAAWTRGALLGALGVRDRGTSGASGVGSGEPVPVASPSVAASGVRVFQLVALVAAGSALVLTLIRS